MSASSAYKKKIVIIPSFMPNEKLIELVGELKEKNFDIIVIDDGSSNDRSDIFIKAESCATVLRHEKNLGKGAAIKTGLKYVLKNFETPYTIVTADSDGQHRADDILAICAESELNRHTLILGSRQMNRGVPLKSRLGNDLARAFFRIKTGHKISDTQTGLRAFPCELISTMISIEGDRYEYEMNVLLYFTKHKIPVKEKTIKTIYYDKNCETHFDPLMDTLRIYLRMVKHKGK